MAKKEVSSKPEVQPYSTKVQKIQKIYGKSNANATLEQASEYLKSKHFNSLADFLLPAK